MVVTLVAGPTDLARLRLAWSPLWETVMSLRALVDPASHALHLPWVREVRPRVGELDDLDLLVALVPVRGYIPDFLTPPPSSPLPELGDELAPLPRLPAEQVRRDLGWAFPGGVPPILQRLADHPASELPRVVAALAAYHEVALAPWWPRVRALLEADVAHRACVLAEHGAEAVLAGLHRDIRWDGSALRVQVAWTETAALSGRGLVVMPLAFAWPRVLTLFDEPWQPAVIYPPRGVATLWEAPLSPAPRGLGRLLGRTRAGLLDALAAPASTTELAVKLGTAASTVSAHLGVLRGAGLVTGRREGRTVLYARTAAGDALVAAQA